ncbi:MAG: DM13 domain-containing protein [Prochlorotrichaceae cyanobacterium]|jgi:hypothetical protein
MKSYRFLLVTVLNFSVIGLLGCIEDQAIPPISSSSVSTSSIVTPVANSPSPEVVNSLQSSVLSSGTFVDGEHPTKGNVQIVMQNNDRYLELDQAFATSTAGPDLVVILHRSADVIGSTTPPAFPIQEGDYVFLAELTSYSGAQRYAIPDSVNLDDFQSVAIWCRRFNATFGAATLKT